MTGSVAEPRRSPARWVFVVLRWFLVYVVVELAAIIGLAYLIGPGWTVLAVLATFLIGLAVAGSQLTRQIRRLRGGIANPYGAITDGVIVAIGVVLVAIPGMVSTVLGVLLLLPPTRALARPVLTMLAARRMPFLTAAAAGAGRYAGRRDYIDYVDGEVVDVTREPRQLPALEQGPGPSAPAPRPPAAD